MLQAAALGSRPVSASTANAILAPDAGWLLAAVVMNNVVQTSAAVQGVESALFSG
jgi:hypothetical protein